MRTKTLGFMLALLLAVAIGASPAAAKGCRKRCKPAIKACVAHACSKLSGHLKAGCRRGLRIELIGSCKHFPTSPICETIAAENCNNL